jgi:hypothetical protein
VMSYGLGLQLEVCFDRLHRLRERLPTAPMFAISCGR